MAILKTEDKEVEVPDNESLIDAAQELGVLFSCENGTCGTCLTNIEEGEENLNELTPAEKDYGIEEGENRRLMCQCRIKEGEVKIRYDGF
ncbi:2Fe-2S iron-sulfur cluster binding domain-containing protein [Candidatus Pacearchaeota archaeon]|nr:2Fe-2S iron-sulfur cluster binding domain-containing protein [Candidatus Pacearchaeota archaeon]